MKKLYLLLGAMSLSYGTFAQTTLPTSVTLYDFEGVTSAADLQAELVGKGEFLKSSDDNFGTYYQNNPDGEKTSHANYLILPTQGFIKSQLKDNTQFSIGFWMNAYVANEKQGGDANGHYFSTAIAGYSMNDSYKAFQWPMFSARTRQTLQINCAGWSDFVNEENVNGANIESNEWTHTKLYETEEVDEEGNVIKADKGFDDNWHYVTITFNGLNAKYWVDGEIKNEWNATNNNYSFPSVMNSLDALYLGDCGPFWQDKDGAYAYDDIAFYAAELNQEQIELIMAIKHNTLTEEDKIVVAQSQLQAAMDNLDSYCSSIGDGFSNIAQENVDWLMEEIGDPTNYKDQESINKALELIDQRQANAAAVVKAYEAAVAKIEYLTEFCNSTAYAGAADFKAVLADAQAAISNPKTTDAVAEGIAGIDAAKVAYLFTQTGDAIDVTRAISAPWFVNEAYEPTADADGKYVFPEGANNNLSKAGWTLSHSESLKGATDCTLYFTNSRTTANLFHSSTVAGGVLDVQQTIKNLPAGYYSVSADMSSSSAPSDNHVYATSNGVTKVSGVPQSLSWDNPDGWTTLTSDKVLVGEDGTLTIGATSTTDGTQYKGWFCVTNFKLTYYGTSYDMSEDVKAKSAEVESAIEGLELKGDKAHAKEDLAAVTSSTKSDYEKVTDLTNLLANINSYIAQEKAFTAYDNIKSLRDASDISEMQKAIFTAAANDMNKVLSADATTVDELPALNTLASAFVAYAQTAKAAEEWGTSKATEEVKAQVAAIEGSTAEVLAANQDKLVAIMKASVEEFTASEAEPKDISGLLVNPSFAGDSNAGWTIEGACANWYSECEFFNTNFNISQVIEGLPAGAYRVKVQGYYRDGGREESVANYNTKDEEGNNKFVPNAVLYANSYESAMISMASDSIVGEENISITHADGSNYSWYQPNGSTAESADLVSYPDGMNAAQFCFDAGMYAENAVDVYINAGDPLTIGIKKSAAIANDWTIFDNFQLFYLGKEAPTAIEVAPSAVATPSAIYSVSGARTSMLQKGINIVKMTDGTVKKVLVK